MRKFATKNDDDNVPGKGKKVDATTKTKKKDAKLEASSTEEKPKRKRRTKAEMEEAKLEKEMKKLEKQMNVKGSAASKKTKQKAVPQTMYTLKFNSPILPYAKFPLTQNKYI